MCGCSWVVATFLPNQKLPDGYEVGGEWGELRTPRNGKRVGIGCWHWWIPETTELGDPRATKWEARRDAINHARARGTP